MNFLITIKKIKYTCTCCGYKTLKSNDQGKACPVYSWKNNYFELEDFYCLADYLKGKDHLFYSHMNRMLLYEAQENYKKFGYCDKKYITSNRKSQINEKTDLNWVSIQEKLEDKYHDTSLIIAEFKNLAEHFRYNQAESEYFNFNSLSEEEIINIYECRHYTFDGYYYTYNFATDTYNLEKKLLLKVLTLMLANKSENLLLNIIIDYFSKGINYYIFWSILLLIFLEANSNYFSQLLTDILLKIKEENYYNLKRLEKTIKEYWLKLLK